MPSIDDIIPFMRKKTKDVADTVEKNRKEMIEDQKKRKMGTLSGLEGIIAKRKRDIEEASHYSD